jgi:hypothetical protein
MADFHDRLIEDLGHEISDVVIAGEELLQAPARPDDPLQFAREFRSLLATLEMGIRLLQWDDFATFLASLGLKFDAAFVLEESLAAVRSKMQKTVRLLLKIYEGFDGVRFSQEQLMSWSQESELIWESEDDPTAWVEKPASRESSARSQNLPVSEMMTQEAFSAIEHEPEKKQTGPGDYVLSVEIWGQEFLYPLEKVVGLTHLTDHEFSEKSPTQRTIEYKGTIYPFSQLSDFQGFRPYAGIERLKQAQEIVFLRGKNSEALKVDRIIGIQRIEKLSEGETRSNFRKLSPQGHLPARWLYCA